MGLRESASAFVDAEPGAVFDVVTDVATLPEWNAGIVEIVEAPPGPLRPEVEWKVKVRALGQSWVSRSRVTDIDRDHGRFAYRSQSDDGNPSFADWEWRVEPDGTGSSVRVTVDINPRTFWRRRLLVKLRRSGLRKEMEASLDALRARFGA